MDRQQLPVAVEWKAGRGSGELEGYASVFGNVDLGGDVVLPGAFRKTISDWRRATQPLPLIADHDKTTVGVIGSIRDLAEDQVGLKFKAQFSSTQKAQDARTNILEGHLKGTSFTYLPMKSRPGRIGDDQVRFLEEVRLFEITVTPFPMNLLAGVTAAKATESKAVTDKPWDGSASRFTPEQYRRSCLINTGQGDVDSKARYKLPVKEPDGTINRNGVHAAAAALAGGRGGVNASPEQLRSAARKLAAIYREMGEDMPESLRRMMAGSASMDPDWLESMRKALDIGIESARKAAVDELIVAAALTDHEEAAPVDGPGTSTDAAPQGTSDDAAAYALSVINSPEPHDDALTGEPPDALTGPLAGLERDRSNAQIDSLESELARDLARALGEE